LDIGMEKENVVEKQITNATSVKLRRKPRSKK
jgi:hypothetical protein